MIHRNSIISLAILSEIYINPIWLASKKNAIIICMFIGYVAKTLK